MTAVKQRGLIMWASILNSIYREISQDLPCRAWQTWGQGDD